MNPNIAGNHLESDPPWVMEAYGTYDLNVQVFYIEKISPSERKNGQNETASFFLSSVALESQSHSTYMLSAIGIVWGS